MKILRSDRAGLVLIVIALISLSQLLYFSYAQRELASCQTDVNIAFLETLRERAAINDGDRTAIRDLVTELTTAKTEKESQAALEQYHRTNEQLDALRSSFEYPDVDGAC